MEEKAELENLHRSTIWRRSNKKRRDEWMKEWRSKNKDAINAKARAAAKRRREKARDLRVKMTPEEKRAVAKRKQKEWKVANKDRFKKYARKFYHASLENKLKSHMHTRRRRAVKQDASVGEDYQIYCFELELRKKKRVRCHWCGGVFCGKDVHMDHVIPLARGGKHSLENIVTACAHCNHAKHATSPEIFNTKQKQPRLFI